MKQSPAVSRIFLPLILINHIDPAMDAEDQLKPDLVESAPCRAPVRHPEFECGWQ